MSFIYTLASENGGETWSPHNKNVRTGFLAKEYPMVGQGVHLIALHPDNPVGAQMLNYIRVNTGR